MCSRLQVTKPQTFFFFSFPKILFILSPSIRLSGRDDLSPSKQGFYFEGRRGGEEGRRGQRRSTPEAFLLLLKTERPSRPFWKTWMSLIKIQLPYSSGADGAQVDVVFFSTRFVTFLAGQTGFSDEFILTLIVGVCTVTRGVDVVRPRACPPSAGSCICPVPSHWVSDSERWGRPLGGIRDERNVSWTPQEPSCHNTKDTNTPCQDGQRDVNTEGRGGEEGEMLCVWLFEVGDKSFE